MHLTLKYIVILCARINSGIDQTIYVATKQKLMAQAVLITLALYQ